MSVPREVVILVAVSAWLCPKMYAPICGTYPGLPSLIEQSDVIAAVTILKRLSEEDMGGSARYKIEFDKVLKGTPSQKQVTASLRKLALEAAERTPPPQPVPTTHYFGPAEFFEPFRPSSRWVVFLAKAKREKGVPYTNVNCMGSTFPISPLRDLNSLEVQSLSETLKFLFREYVDFKRTEQKELDEQLDVFLHDGDK
jgi:hypothetical protein